MARKLTEVEKFYVVNNTHLTADEIAKTVKGTGIKAIQEVLDVAIAAQTAAGIEPLKAGEKGESALKGKTEEEVKEIVNSQADEHRSGNLFARREGVVVMTEAAGELADARKILANKQSTRDNSDKIHVINKNKKPR